MLRARRRAEWARTAEILAMLYNTNRDPKNRAIPAERFNPYRETGG
jgi:hypothetical protein